MVLDEVDDDAAPAPADLPGPTTSKAAEKKEKRMRKSKVQLMDQGSKYLHAPLHSPSRSILPWSKDVCSESLERGRWEMGG